MDHLVDVKGKGRKLVQRKVGPFEITEVVGPTDSYPMHNVVNIQHLTRYYDSEDFSRPRLANPRDHIKVSEEYEVDKIVGERKDKGVMLYRVRWKGYDAEDDTWQTARDLRNAPELLKDWRAQSGKATWLSCEILLENTLKLHDHHPLDVHFINATTCPVMSLYSHQEAQ